MQGTREREVGVGGRFLVYGCRWGRHRFDTAEMDQQQAVSASNGTIRGVAHGVEIGSVRYQHLNPVSTVVAGAGVQYEHRRGRLTGSPRLTRGCALWFLIVRPGNPRTLSSG